MRKREKEKKRQEKRGWWRIRKKKWQEERKKDRGRKRERKEERIRRGKNMSWSCLSTRALTYIHTCYNGNIHSYIYRQLERDIVRHVGSQSDKQLDDFRYLWPLLWVEPCYSYVHIFHEWSKGGENIIKRSTGERRWVGVGVEIKRIMRIREKLSALVCVKERE